MSHYFIIETQEKFIGKFIQLFTKLNIKARLIKPKKCIDCGCDVNPKIEIKSDDECVECALKRFDHIGLN